MPKIPYTYQSRSFLQQDGRMRITFSKDATQFILANGLPSRGYLFLAIDIHGRIVLAKKPPSGNEPDIIKPEIESP